MYLWDVAITEAFCSATVEAFSITFPAGESSPHDTLMHYLSFANSISTVSPFLPAITTTYT